MKIILLSLMLSSCVSYPKFKKEYECNKRQKEMLPEFVLDCINSTFTQKHQHSEQIIDYCHGMALRSICAPVKMFETVIPFISKSAAIHCDDARSAMEKWVCDE